MYKRLESFLEKYDMLYKYQYGFRTGRYLGNIYSALNDGNYLIGVYVDFRKAS